MSKSTPKAFDCVQSMRQVRDNLNEEIGDKSYEELIRWLRSYRYSDPFLRRLAERAARQADGAADASRRR
jgi:hypothetical protein